MFLGEYASLAAWRPPIFIGRYRCFWNHVKHLLLLCFHYSSFWQCQIKVKTFFNLSTAFYSNLSLIFRFIAPLIAGPLFHYILFLSFHSICSFFSHVHVTWTLCFFERLSLKMFSIYKLLIEQIIFNDQNYFSFYYWCARRDSNS